MAEDEVPNLRDVWEQLQQARMDIVDAAGIYLTNDDPNLIMNKNYFDVSPVGDHLIPLILLRNLFPFLFVQIMNQ